MVSGKVIVASVLATLVVAGGLVAVWFLAPCLIRPCAEVKLAFVPALDLSIISRDENTALAGATTNLSSIKYFGMLIDTIRLCSGVVNELYTFEGVTYRNEKPDYPNCVTVYSGTQRPANVAETGDYEGLCTELEDLYDNNKFTDFADPSEVNALFGGTFGVPTGTYSHVEMTFVPEIRLDASVNLVGSDGSTTQTIYTKTCGIGVCDSICNGQDNMRDCAGNSILSGLSSSTPYGTVAATTTNPSVSDIWSPTPFNSTGLPDGGYFRRCDKDMTTGPSEEVFVENFIGDSVLAKLAAPFEVTAGQSLDLNMAYDLSFAVRGEVKPNEATGGNEYQHTNFYEINDGFYSIGISSFPMQPVIKDSSEKIIAHKYNIRLQPATAQVLCADGDVVQGNGQCHPCFGFAEDCVEDGNVLNNQNYDLSSAVLEQAFDIHVDVYYVVPGTQALNDTVTRAQIGSVAVYASFPDDATQAVNEVVPFYPMSVDDIVDNEDDATRVDLTASWHVSRGFSFRRLRNLDLDLLTSAGQKTTTQADLPIAVVNDVDHTSGSIAAWVRSSEFELVDKVEL